MRILHAKLGDLIESSKPVCKYKLYSISFIYNYRIYIEINYEV